MQDILAPIAAVPGIEARALIAVAFTGVAAYYDMFNKKWVPDWAAYLSIALAFAANIAFFDPQVFISAAAVSIAVFAITYILYRLGQLGGADVYIMSAIALALPHFSKPLLAQAQNVPYPFIFSVLIPTGIAFMLHMLLRFIPYVSSRLASGKIRFTHQQAAEVAVLFVSLALFTAVLSSMPIPLPPLYLALFSFLAVSLVFFSLFKREIKDSMIEHLPNSRLCEEDILALEKMSPRIVKRLSLSSLMDRKMIMRIRKAKLSRVPVYTGMPFFLPYLLIGLLFTLLFGDLFLYLL